jgi:hypothetical protein
MLPPVVRQVAACTALLWFTALAWAAEPPPAAQPVQLAPNSAAEIAHSALLSATARVNAGSLQLLIRRVSDKSPVDSDAVTVTVDGRNERFTRQAGGQYELAINNFRGEGSRDIEIIVPHDGIREILSGRLSLVEASSTQSLLGDHKQIAWWILNIVVVLIAAIAISRRKG